MIPKYDELEESVKLYQAKLKGKVMKGVDQQHLKKNKKIDQDKKMHKIRVVKARQLRIKVNQVFNHQILKTEPFSSRRFENNELLNSSRLFLANKKNSQPLGYSSQKQISSYKSLQQCKRNKQGQTKVRFLSRQKQQQTGGLINLFQDFSQQELNEIQSNYQYFLVNAELVELFRKYMTKKRMNSKDHSYQNFMLKSGKDYLQLPSHRVAKMSKPQIKQYIVQSIQTLANYGQPFKPRLQTKPLSTEPTSDKRNDKRHKSEQSRSPVFLQLKKRQIQNQERLKIQQQKKRRKLKIAIFYDAGVASEIRAVQFDKRQKMFSKRLDLQNKRTIDCRNRVATLNHEYGKSAELVEQIRKEFIKKRKLKQRQIVA